MAQLSSGMMERNLDTIFEMVTTNELESKIAENVAMILEAQ